MQLLKMENDQLKTMLNYVKMRDKAMGLSQNPEDIIDEKENKSE